MPMDELRQTFLAETAETLRTVNSLMLRQEDQHDAERLGEAVRRSMHRVKGTCGFLGLPRLEALAHAIEECLAPTAHLRSPSDQAVVRAALDRMDRIIGRVDARKGAEPLGSDGDVLVALEEISGPRPAQIAGEPRVSWDGEGLPAAKPATAQPPILAVYSGLADRLSDEHLRRILTRLAEIAVRQPAALDAADMQRVGEVWPLLARAAGELAAAAGKEIFFRTEGGDIVVDRDVAQRLFQPLLQLVRNAIAHGIEPPEARRWAGKPVAGRITLSARQASNRLVIEIADDGAGIEATSLDQIFAPGFSTQPQPTRLAGRGIGLDIVRNDVEAIDGLVGVRSEAGRGATFTLDVPVSLKEERGTRAKREKAEQQVELQRSAAAGSGSWR